MNKQRDSSPIKKGSLLKNQIRKRVLAQKEHPFSLNLVKEEDMQNLKRKEKKVHN